MDKPAQPWAELSYLQDLAAELRQRWLGRSVFRVSVGPDWMRFHWAGEDRAGLILSSRQGSNLAWAVKGTWDEPVRRALPLAKGHIIAQKLTEAKLTGLGILPQDRVWALRFETREGEVLTLLHQVFGARGNTALLDEKARLLWARHKLPHSLLTTIPPRSTWQTGHSRDLGAEADQLFATMEDNFLQRLAQDVFVRQHSAIKRVVSSSSRLVENLGRDLERADRGEEFRRTAEALAAQLHTLRQGQETAEIHNLEDGTPLSVVLDPALTPAANMESWFRKARKADKGREIIATNLDRGRELAARQQEALQQILPLAEESDPVLKLAGLHQWVDTHAELLPRIQDASGSKTHSPDEPARPFRRYLIDEKWEVWVGRNNKENDELTHRASHVQDIWLHAQGVPGSHVILRTMGKPEQVPRSVLEKAAGLAALNCRARNSALVPVIFTERRYVRKPRKAPPGTAVCLREKNVFVEPGIASGVNPI